MPPSSQMGATISGIELSYTGHVLDTHIGVPQTPLTYFLPIQ